MFKAFYCAEEPGLPDTTGCLLSCGPDEVAAVDVAARTWECQPRAEGFVCPGEFHIDCKDSSPVTDCHCDGEIWINDDCTQGFR